LLTGRQAVPAVSGVSQRERVIFGTNHPGLFQRLKALSGGEIPDADLSFVDLDFSAVQHLESGGSGLFDSDRDEPVRWEDDPYWLVDSED
jgi:hypothetical protein